MFKLAFSCCLFSIYSNLSLYFFIKILFACTTRTRHFGKHVVHLRVLIKLTGLSCVYFKFLGLLFNGSKPFSGVFNLGPLAFSCCLFTVYSNLCCFLDVSFNEFWPFIEILMSCTTPNRHFLKYLYHFTLHLINSILYFLVLLFSHFLLSLHISK